MDVAPARLGTRKLVTLTTALLLIPLIGWGIAVQNPSTSYTTFMILAFLSGIGGGAFSGFMPSTSYFFPRRKQGTALGLQAGIGNFGVSIVQFVTPWIIGFSLLGILGASQTFHDPANNTNHPVWEQNAAFIYVPFVIVAAVLAWTMLKSVPVRANFRQQLDIFTNIDTWFMTALYVMTFGTFAGLSAQFGLLIKNLYGAGNTAIVATAADGSTSVLVPGYTVPLALSFAFLGPLVGAATRVAFAPLTDRHGGARWTLVAGIGILVSLLFTMMHVNPDPAQGAAALHREFVAFLVRHHRHLLLHRHRQRVHVQADADDLRAPSGRRRHRMDLSHRGLRTLLLRCRPGRREHHRVLHPRRRVRRGVHRAHLGPLRTTGRPQALLIPPTRRVPTPPSRDPAPHLKEPHGHPHRLRPRLHHLVRRLRRWHLHVREG